MEIAMDEDLNDPVKKDMMKYINMLHCSDLRHPEGSLVTAPFSCLVGEFLIKEGMILHMGQPILKGLVPLSSLPMKISSESQKSRFRKALESRPCVSVYPLEDVLVDPNADDISTNSSFAKLDNEVVMKRYENFKKFDIVMDHSDHLFSAYCSEIQRPNWVNTIKEEWRILEEHLPETIFVRAYESRMDLLRAVIIGLEGTPYHNGLFVFDVFFPDNYPISPPLVRYHSGGLGINPVINTCGQVSLSLVTAAGGRENFWVPGMNALQLLLSIQNLVLNTKPLFNGYMVATFRNSVFGEWLSLLYNENTIIKSLKTMVYTMNKPPMNFEDLVVGHFRNHVRDILMTCEAFIEGRQFWCLPGDIIETYSVGFKNDVASFIMPLVDTFVKIGAKEAQEFQYLSKKMALTDENINDTVNKKRKAVFDGDLNDEVSKNKDIDICHGSDHQFVPWNVFTHRDCVVTKILIKNGMLVKKGEPLYECYLLKGKKVTMPISSISSTSSIKKILKENHSSRVGIFSMDELVDQNHAEYSPVARINKDVLKRYENFKKFESVVDHSDHFFSAPQSSATDQPPSDWVNKIHEEWRILEECLPETIFVRVYESRIDLLRAVIIGPEGTPFHGGLFFFDMCFPSDYPNSPPLVHYHSGGFAINPNLSEYGKVRLSLPQKSGGQQMMWVPDSSTVLQLLVSMQELIFIDKPIFNDLTYALMRDSNYGNLSSFLYNENTCIKSLKTMVHTMYHPPKNFEDFVIGHFRKRARDILTMAYTKKNYSMTHGKDLYSCLQPLVMALGKIGAKKSEISFWKKVV